MKRQRKLPPDTDLFAHFKSLDPAGRADALERLGEEEREAFDRAWQGWAHAGQLAPPACPDGSPWSTWVIKAGRGFGKTLAGAQWLLARIAEGAPLRIALVGATIDDARRVMVEGRSGLLEVAGAWIAEWVPAMRRLRFTTGAEAALFSGQSPDMLRGPEHHYAWCDELAKWDKPQECWDMLQLGLRLGANPQAVVTTTPRSGPVLSAIIADPATVTTGGPTSANRHLPRVWHARMHRLYAGTRLGRQELDGELLPDAAGALWSVELLERCRTGTLSPSGERVGEWGPQAPSPDSPSPSLSPEGERGQLIPAPSDGCPSSPASGGGVGEADGGGWADTPSGTRPFTRTLIAVDPPTGDGTCGIVACAREGHGATAIAHVLADHSVTARSPEGWASAVAAAAEAHATTEVIAERNQGGEMVRAILHAADPRLHVRLVHAGRGKSQRAEPVAHLFEAGRVRLHGRMPELEAQLLGMIAGGGYEGPPKSPDRADAMVLGVSELMKERAEARVRVL